MTPGEVVAAFHEKPNFFILYCPDTSLRSTYVKLFAEAHGGKIVYSDEPSLKQEARIIGKKPVTVVYEWEPAIKKPNPKYLKTNRPTLLMYTRKGPIPTAVEEAYPGRVAEIPEVTGEQATVKLRSIGLPDDLIELLKSKTSVTQEAMSIGELVLSLSHDLNVDPHNCFNQYFAKSLEYRNVDEEPTDFLDNILHRKYNETFEYLYTQRGNEFYVYAAILNWLEDIIKFCSCNGDYWNDAGLVSAKYKSFKECRLNHRPFVVWVRLYEKGLKSMQSLKLNESDPSTALEVFVCSIIQMM